MIDWQGNGTSQHTLEFENEDGDFLVRAIGINQLIVNRLCAWKFWSHSSSGEWAKILYKTGLEHNYGLDVPYLQNLAAKEDVSDMLDRIINKLDDDDLLKP